MLIDGWLLTACVAMHNRRTVWMREQYRCGKPQGVGKEKMMKNSESREESPQVRRPLSFEAAT